MDYSPTTTKQSTQEHKNTQTCRRSSNNQGMRLRTREHNRPINFVCRRQRCLPVLCRTLPDARHSLLNANSCTCKCATRVGVILARKCEHGAQQRNARSATHAARRTVRRELNRARLLARPPHAQHLALLQRQRPKRGRRQMRPGDAPAPCHALHKCGCAGNGDACARHVGPPRAARTQQRTHTNTRVLRLAHTQAHAPKIHTHKRIHTHTHRMRAAHANHRQASAPCSASTRSRTRTLDFRPSSDVNQVTRAPSAADSSMMRVTKRTSPPSVTRSASLTAPAEAALGCPCVHVCVRVCV
jgi:hypothetical protein